MPAVAAEEHPDIKFVRANVSDLSFLKDKYDVVFSFLAAHYVDGVEKYHRTFSEIVNSLCSSGFTIGKMLEPVPEGETAEQEKRLAKNFHKPDFLLIRAVKQKHKNKPHALNRIPTYPW